MPGLLKVGLTGGIACGRTTVAGILAGPGRLILDADAVAHSLTENGGSAVEAIVAEFGCGVLEPSGGISRPSLARIVFADERARRRLERILHPLILGAIDAEIGTFAARHRDAIAIVDAALMVETGTYRRYHRLVVAHCPPGVQKERLMRRDGLAAEEAESRIAAQSPLQRKIDLADYLIDTGGTMDQTKENTLRVAAMLEEDLGALPDLAPRRRGAAAC